MFADLVIRCQIIIDFQLTNYGGAIVVFCSQSNSPQNTVCARHGEWLCDRLVR